MKVTTVSIHDVVSVEVGAVFVLSTTGRSARSIKVIDKRGHLFEVVLFADSAGPLALIEAMEPAEEALARDEVAA